MHRIDTAGNTGNMFVDKDPANGTPGTIVNDDWLNAVQEELVAVALEDGGALVKGSNAQVLSKLKSSWTQNVATISALRAITPTTTRRVYVKSHTTEGDDSHGIFRSVINAAVGTYIDDDCDVILPTGGDGSTAWLRETITSKRNSLEYYSALMAAGVAIDIACYGDSTTDGTATTGWTANPVDGSGEATGTIDHEATAPNAWPAKLKTMLRSMFNNTSINVWNAGYTGKRLDDGWAYRNYDTAVTNNPYYGTPDICLIAFGLNDIAYGPNLTNHARETRKLVKKLQRSGTLPVLLTCDATLRNEPSVRDHKESNRQINALKISMAEELQIPIIDIHDDLIRWMSRNQDGRRWYVEQTDGLHFEDGGHAFKSGAIAHRLFVDTVEVTNQWMRLITFDSRASYVGDYTTIYALSNLDQGGNVQYAAAAPANTTMMTAWLWNESPDTELIYRGIENDNYDAAGTANAPSVRVTEQIGGVATRKYLITAGFSADGSFRKSDQPFRFGHIPYGLSKIEYISGDSTTTLFYGNFELWQTRKNENYHNGLKNSGQLYKTFPATGINVEFLPEYKDGSNVVGPYVGEMIDVMCDITMPVGAGFVIAACNGWDGTIGYGSKTFSLLYHSTDNRIKLYQAMRNSAGTITFSAAVMQSAVLTWGTARKQLRITIERVLDDQVINVYEGYTSTTPIMTATRPITFLSVNFAGAVGGLYWHSTDAGGAGTAILHELLIDRS